MTTRRGPPPSPAGGDESIGFPEFWLREDPKAVDALVEIARGGGTVSP